MTAPALPAIPVPDDLRRLTLYLAMFFPQAVLQERPYNPVDAAIRLLEEHRYQQTRKAEHATDRVAGD